MRLTPAGTAGCILFVAIACGAPRPDTDVRGDWEGMLETDRRPTLLRLHLFPVEGAWGGSMDIPGVGSVPLSETAVDGPRVAFVLPVEGGLRFEATQNGDTLSGRAWQGEESVAFRLRREPTLPPATGRGEAWQQDLAIVEEKLLSYDRSFSEERRAEARRRLRALQTSAASIHDDEVIVELSRIVALSGNAHTRLYLLRNRSALRRLPIRVWWFGDDLYVIRARETAEPALGRRVLALGGHDPREARAAVASLFSGNESWTDYKSTYFLTSPEVLHGLGLVPDPQSVTLAFEGADGRRQELALEPLPLERSDTPTEAWWSLSPRHGDSGWKLPPLPATPLSLEHPEQPYWVKALEKEGMVYVSFSRTRRAEGPGLLELVQTAAAETRAPVLVLDLRWNTGGDNSAARPFLEWLEGSRFNAPNRLFVVTGRATFSAGLYCAAWLAQHTDALFVGEPVGDALDYWAEGGNIPLPHSGLTVHFANGFHGYSTRAYPEREPFFEDLSLESLDLDLPVTTSFDDWRSGRDPVLEAIVRRTACGG